MTKDQERIRRVGEMIITTCIEKNHDYGKSIWRSPILNPNLSPLDGLWSRMSDKVERLIQLNQVEAQVDESIEDTIMDLAGYCILYMARPMEPEEIFKTKEASQWLR